MAEISDTPPAEDPLDRRIREYFASPKAQEHFLQGFTQGGSITSYIHQKQFPDVHAVDKLTSLQKRTEELRKGLQAGEKLTGIAACGIRGHRWYPAPAVNAYLCEDCGISRSGAEGPTAPVPSDFGREVNFPQIKEPIKLPTWSCFYCGAEYEDEEALLDHEDDCAED